MTTKPPTAPGISRLLAKAGFERSVSHTTRIKGWHDWNEGFRVERGYDDGTVVVRHVMDKWAHGDEADKRHAEHLASYAKTLSEAGYAWERDETFGRPKLVVTAGEG